MEQTHTWEKHFRYLSDYFAHSLNVTSERRPRAHAHLLKFTQLCVFASSCGWAAVRAAHITLRSHESADAACGSSRLSDSKKRLSRRIRRSGSGTFHLFSHPVSPTPSVPQARTLALVVACGARNEQCALAEDPAVTSTSFPWNPNYRNHVLDKLFQILRFSQRKLHAQTCTTSFECQNDCIPLKQSPKQGRLSWVPAGCWWVSAASQRLWWGRRGYRVWRRRRRRRRLSQTEVAAFYLDPYDTKPLLLSLFLND